MSERRSSTACMAVERPDHHCGDDLISLSMCVFRELEKKANEVQQLEMAQRHIVESSEKLRQTLEVGLPVIHKKSLIFSRARNHAVYPHLVAHASRCTVMQERFQNKRWQVL